MPFPCHFLGTRQQSKPVGGRPMPQQGPSPTEKDPGFPVPPGVSPWRWGSLQAASRAGFGGVLPVFPISTAKNTPFRSLSYQALSPTKENTPESPRKRKWGKWGGNRFRPRPRPSWRLPIGMGKQRGRWGRHAVHAPQKAGASCKRPCTTPPPPPDTEAVVADTRGSVVLGWGSFSEGLGLGPNPNTHRPMVTRSRYDK